MCTFARYWNVMPLTYDAKGIVTEDAANPYVGEEARINKIPARQVENLPARSSGPSTSCCWLATLWICPMWRS